MAAVSVGVSLLKPAAPTVELATVRTDTVKRDPMLRQMRGSRQIPAETEATVVRIHMQYQGLRAKLESDLMNKKAGAATVRGRRTADNGKPTQEPKSTFSL